MTMRVMRRWATSSRSTSSTPASTRGRGPDGALTLASAKELRAALDRAITAAQFEEAEVSGQRAPCKGSSGLPDTRDGVTSARAQGLSATRAALARALDIVSGRSSWWPRRCAGNAAPAAH